MGLHQRGHHNCCAQRPEGSVSSISARGFRQVRGMMDASRRESSGLMFKRAGQGDPQPTVAPEGRAAELAQSSRRTPRPKGEAGRLGLARMRHRWTTVQKQGSRDLNGRCGKWHRETQDGQQLTYRGSHRTGMELGSGATAGLKGRRKATGRARRPSRRERREGLESSRAVDRKEPGLVESAQCIGQAGVSASCNATTTPKRRIYLR